MTRAVNALKVEQGRATGAPLTYEFADTLTVPVTLYKVRRPALPTALWRHFKRRATPDCVPPRARLRSRAADACQGWRPRAVRQQDAAAVAAGG